MTVACLFAAPPTAIHAHEPDEKWVRERSTVSVGGETETWELVWEEAPSSVCSPEEVYEAITCPCAGLSYGEFGKLALVRKRGGAEIERMDLRPLFGGFDFPDAERLQGMAYAQRWPMADDDFARESRGDPTLVSDIKRRPAPKLIRLADYDHDDKATEFLIQVGTMPCGHLEFAAVGVSPSNPRLHALTTSAHPERPLIMPPEAWQTLLNSTGPTVVQTLACMDHGSTVRSELQVSAAGGAISVISRDYSCEGEGEAGKLVSQEEL